MPKTRIPPKEEEEKAIRAFEGLRRGSVVKLFRAAAIRKKIFFSSPFKSCAQKLFLRREFTFPYIEGFPFSFSRKKRGRKRLKMS